jgi:hypothetical protein
MPDEDAQYPQCFGDLDTVFPHRENGFRESPQACFECPHKTACLRAAMERLAGLKVREEQVDRAYESGLIGFMRRWSQKKDLRRRMKAGSKDPKGG